MSQHLGTVTRTLLGFERSLSNLSSLLTFSTVMFSSIESNISFMFSFSEIKFSSSFHERSVQFSSPLPEAELREQQILQEIRKEKELAIKSKKTKINSELNKNDICSLDLASEKGASSWLTAMPLKRCHFDLTKSEFRDGISLRYDWDPVKMPSLCACNENFTVAHVLYCPKGEYTQMAHNEIRDSFANFLCNVCHDVEIEPHLRPLEGETFAPKSTTNLDDARLDIKANGLWESRFNKTYFDKKKFQPAGKKLPCKK